MAIINSRIKLKRWNGTGHTSDYLVPGAPLFNTSTRELLIGYPASDNGSQISSSGILVNKSKSTKEFRDNYYHITSDNSLNNLTFKPDVSSVSDAPAGNYGEFDFNGSIHEDNNVTYKSIIKSNMNQTEFYREDTISKIKSNGDVEVGNNLTVAGKVTAIGGFEGDLDGVANNTIKGSLVLNTPQINELKTALQQLSTGEITAAGYYQRVRAVYNNANYTSFVQNRDTEVLEYLTYPEQFAGGNYDIIPKKRLLYNSYTQLYGETEIELGENVKGKVLELYLHEDVGDDWIATAPCIKFSVPVTETNTILDSNSNTVLVSSSFIYIYGVAPENNAFRIFYHINGTKIKFYSDFPQLYVSKIYRIIE